MLVQRFSLSVAIIFFVGLAAAARPAVAVVVLQHEYAATADGTAVTDGMLAGSGAPFSSAEFFDDSGFETDVSLCQGDADCEQELRDLSASQKRGQFNVYNNNENPNHVIKYALEGESLPPLVFQNGASSASLNPSQVPDYDGSGIRATGDTFVRYFDAPEFNLTGSFTAFIRVHPQAGRNITLNNPAGHPRQTLFGSGTSSGWDVHLDDGIPVPDDEQLAAGQSGGLPTEATLNIQFGRQAANPGTSEAMELGIPVEQRPVIRYGEWVDIVAVFEGDCDDNSDPFSCDASSGVVDPNNNEDEETVRLYVNGLLAGTVTGAASFNTKPGGISLASPGDSFGNQALNAFVERVVFWNEALSDEAIAALSPTIGPPGSPADLNMDGFVDGLDLGILLGNFGSSSDAAGGELSGTAPVDGLDLGILLGEWNPAALQAPTAVPEPASWLLALLSAACLVQRRRN